MKLHAVQIFLFILISSSALTQTPYKTYNLPAETSSPRINCLYQLKNGYILVGATTGVYKFDGVSFQKLSKEKKVPDNITAICETKDDKIWIGFGDGKLGWLQNNMLVLQNPEEGLPTKTVTKIIQDSAGVVWIATAGEGVYYYIDKRFYNINTDDGLTDNYVYDIALSENKIAAGTDRGINFCSLTNGKKQVSAITSANGSLPDNIVRCLSAENDLLIFGMQDAGIGIKRPDLSYTKDWQYGTINALLYDKGSTWIATESSGLLMFDNFPFKYPTKIISQKVTALLKDTEGNIWAAANNQLIRTSGNKLQPLIQLSTAEASNLHTLLLDRDNHIWFNINSGLKHLSKDKSGKWLEKIFTLPVSINSQITALYEDKFENVWIGTMGNGVFILDPATGRFRKVTEDKLLLAASILSITGKGDQVWIASLEGAVRCKLTDKNSQISSSLQIEDFTTISGIGTNYIYNIFVDSKNRIWFATDGKGIAVYNNGRITNYNRTNGLKSEVVYEVTEDKKGNIWFTTFNAGLVKFDGSQFRHFGIAEGLTDLNITSLEADKYGNLYLGHRNGIDILNTETNSLSYLDDQQGLLNLNTDLNTITADKEGNFYFLADNFLYKYIPSPNNLSPGILIDRVQLFLNDVEVVNGHVFSANEDNISFYYTGLSYSQPGKIQYQYKLDGYGDEWITTNDRRKDFPKLSPGTYTFRVRASLNRNFENAAEATFTFTIKKPLWMRWWFITLSIIFLCILLYWYIKDREKRLQKWERLEKEKIKSQLEVLQNQVNPHFLFNSFNTLVSEIEEDPKRAVEYVEHMADFFRSIVTYREKDMITLHEEVNIINDYLFIQKKRYGCAFEVNIMISDEEQEKYYLAPLTLQLLTENAIKHNSVLKENPLLLDIFIEADQLIVRNNIVPKLHLEKSAGLGLQNIQKRYELLTKKAVMISDDDEFFTVIIPLIKKENGTSADN